MVGSFLPVPLDIRRHSDIIAFGGECYLGFLCHGLKRVGLRGKNEQDIFISLSWTGAQNKLALFLGSIISLLCDLG